MTKTRKGKKAAAGQTRKMVPNGGGTSGTHGNDSTGRRLMMAPNGGGTSGSHGNGSAG
jgi:hypothetical protein